MASAFGHAATALALGRFLRSPLRTKKFWFLMIVCSILPDADVIAFNLGYAYSHPLGHRGFSHSILFAAILAIFLTLVFFPAKQGAFGRLTFSRRDQRGIAFMLFLSTLSHGLLDAATNGGLGVGFFIPFDNTRYFFPFRPIEVSPISIAAFFQGSGWTVLKSELVWIGRLIFVIFFVQWLIQKIGRARRRSGV